MSGIKRPAADRQRPKGPQLRYDQIRERIQDGDVLLFQGLSWISRLIRWVSNSPYSHAGIALWWQERLMVIQAAGRGVEILAASTAVRRYDGQVDWWQPNEDVRARLNVKVLIHSSFDELGKPYGVLPLAALAARMFRGKERGNPDAKGKVANYFCSQLVSRCYRRAGVDLVRDKADQDTSPGDLAHSGQLVFRGVLRKHAHGIPAPESSQNSGPPAANAA